MFVRLGVPLLRHPACCWDLRETDALEPYAQGCLREKCGYEHRRRDRLSEVYGYLLDSAPARGPVPARIHARDELALVVGKWVPVNAGYPVPSNTSINWAC